MISETNMPPLSIKRFAHDHLILVEDICSKDLHSVDATTPIQELQYISVDTGITWVLITVRGLVIGAVHKSTVLHALRYSSPNLHIEALIEVIPQIVQAKDTLNIDNVETTSLSIVHNTDGTLIGLLDQWAFDRVQSRHMLRKDDQDRLLSDPIIQQIFQVTQDIDAEVYVIGGWVRDFILGLPNLDLDFAVVGDALHLATTLAKQFGGVVHPFKDFGGAHWIVSDTLTVDFTGTRREEYETLGALPTVEPTHIDRDLQRRDFSINAMAIAIHRNKLGLLLDPMHGLLNLEQGVLRTLHGLSFLQDPTRIFRASRYCTRFNMHLDSPTLLQLQQATSIIQIGKMLSHSRIGIELEKIFTENHPERCWNQLCQWGVWTHWQPNWSTLDLFSKSTLPYCFQSEDWQQSWWMQLRLTLSDAQSVDWASMISIRPNGLKLWTQLPNQLESMRNSLQLIDLEAQHWKRQVGDALKKSTPTHWLLLESTYPNCLPCLEWWIEIGCHNSRHTTGADILQMGVPEGPQISQLLSIAQHIAWEGGTAEDEIEAIQVELSNRTSPVKNT